MGPVEMGRSNIISKLKEKRFSSKGKIERYNQDGTETIIVMGRPFCVIQKISENVDEVLSAKRHSRKFARDVRSYVVLVENIERLLEFPRHLVLKRSFFNVDELLLAHREPDVLGRAKDKNIVRVFHSEITRSDGKIGVTVAMEYCSNNLYNRLQQQGRLTESEVVQVLFAITSAVGYLHSQQPPIAHRNICPECVLIQSENLGAAAYRLCNFSSASTEAYQCANREEVALAMEDAERHTTPAFRAPEMSDPGSGRRIDERVDMWSIGVLLYYMMYFQLPFGEAVLGLSDRLKLRFPAGSEMWYTSSLRVALTHLLEPNPEKRWDVFALINFLRFDEDISKYLGTFFFTTTERPEGWEPQDVKVVNRPVPTKAPATHANARQHAGTTNNNASRGVEADAVGEKKSSCLDKLDPAALAALGLDGDTQDPEMRAYYEMLIREEEEVWKNAKHSVRATRPREAEATATADSTPEERTGEQQETQKPKDSAVLPEKKSDILDALFDSAPAPPSSSTAVASFAVPQTVTSQSATLNGDDWKHSLFSDVLPSQQRTQQSYDMLADDGWGSGAPTMAPTIVAGGRCVGDMFSGPQATVNPPLFPTALPPSQQRQQEAFPSWELSGTYPTQTIPPLLQQQQQQCEGPARQPATQGGVLAPAPAQPNPEKKKDPFEDLFL